MTAPVGIQRKRTKGWRMPANTVSVTRPGPLGNPFRVDVFGLDQSIAMHQVWLETETAAALGYEGAEAERLDAMRAEVMRLLPGLRGKNLACTCPEPAPYERDRCHRAFLLKLANAAGTD
ncbi:MAG: hypothetical protein JWO51_98 [Rhodospirillales bacterium]|nr:hypothetical protein [Rhodospirillales bacterium]